MFTKRVSAYRFFWPNFHHQRVIPEEAWIHEVAFELRANSAADYNPKNWPATPRTFHTGDDVLTTGPYVIRRIGVNAPDFAGITFGLSLLTLAWNWLMGSPFGFSWPNWGAFTGWEIGAVAAVFLFLEGIRQGAGSWLRRLAGLAVPALTLVAVPAALVLVRDWTCLQVGFTAGLAFFGLSQLPPKLPIMRADRVLPYVAFSIVLSVALQRVMVVPVRSLLGDEATPHLAELLMVAFSLLAVYWILRDRARMAHDKTREV
jgi:hypothetical protein